MQHSLLLLTALGIVACMTCGCIYAGCQGIPQFPSAAVPLTISINTTPTRYSPVMSSTIGIRLTPVNTSGIIPPEARFTWETTFGSFYHWGPPDFKVIELGSRYSGTRDPIYWSYFSEHGEKERRPVTLTLAVLEPSTGAVLANASLRIGWEDPRGFTAVVEGSG